jgi:hypothetical protein
MILAVRDRLNLLAGMEHPLSNLIISTTTGWNLGAGMADLLDGFRRIGIEWSWEIGTRRNRHRTGTSSWAEVIGKSEALVSLARLFLRAS